MDIKSMAADMENRGFNHALMGFELTPHALQEVDAEIIQAAKLATYDVADYFARVSGQAKIVTKLRGALNRGWNRGHQVRTAA